MSDYRPFTPMNQQDLVFVDLETSSLDPDQGEILELAAVRTSFNLSREVGFVERKTRMNFPERAEASALEKNRYDPREWMNAVSQRVAILELNTLMGDGEIVWVGHNPHFDWGFVRATFKRENLAVPKTKYLVDTASLAWPLCARGHIDRINLETLCKKYGVPNDGSHRAMTDIVRTMKVYCKMLGITIQPWLEARR